MINAFAYLIATSTRNKFASQLRRLRNPRYAIALLLGVGYFWLIFFQRSSQSRRPPAPVDVFSPVVSFAPLVVLVVALIAWLFMKDRAALAFTQAEVSLLFAAPVSRRSLILYKLARGQTAVLSTSLIWVFLLNHGDRAFEHAVSYWLMLSTISLHRLGVALVRTSQDEHGLSGLRRTWPALLIAALVVGSVGWSFYDHRFALMAASETSELVSAVTTVLNAPPASWALYPFHALIAPMLARTTETWSAALPAAAVLFLAHVLWVLQSDAAFEEAAVDASVRSAQRRVARRTRGVSAEAISAKARKRTIPLAPTGEPAVAILWKNYLWLMRTGQLRALVGLPVVLAVLAIVFATRSTLAEILVFTTCMAIAGTTLLFGPMSMRNDLRGELARLPIIKTLPLPGRKIVMAEIASSALPTAAMQFMLVAAGMIAISFFPKEALAFPLRIGVVLGAPIAFIGLNLANFTIHNGIALLFPAWVKIGDTGANGIEAMGQTMLTLIVTMFLLMLLLIVPLLGGAAAWFTLRGLPVAGMVVAGAVGGILLGLESYALMHVLGGQLDRLEPTQVG